MAGGWLRTAPSGAHQCCWASWLASSLPTCSDLCLPHRTCCDAGPPLAAVPQICHVLTAAAAAWRCAAPHAPYCCCRHHYTLTEGRWRGNMLLGRAPPTPTTHCSTAPADPAQCGAERALLNLHPPLRHLFSHCCPSIMRIGWEKIKFPARIKWIGGAGAVCRFSSHNPDKLMIRALCFAQWQRRRGQHSCQGGTSVFLFLVSGCHVRHERLACCPPQAQKFFQRSVAPRSLVPQRVPQSVPCPRVKNVGTI